MSGPPAAPATRRALAALWGTSAPAVATTSDADDARDLMVAVAAEFMEGHASPALMGALLGALAVRGVRLDDLVAFAAAMRARATPIRPRTDVPTIDVCGTGGDGARTINVSTMAALVVAAEGGVAVAKHGNRAVSSSCGSADILEALGIALDVEPHVTQHHLDACSICFMFAPRHHAAMRHVMPVRRELGLPTIFNLLGPLSNPAGVAHQLVGVASPVAFDLYPEALRALGVDRALVVQGEGGLDELTPWGMNRMREVRGHEIIDRRLDGTAFQWGAIDPADLRAPATLEENVALLRAVLAGADRTGRRAAVALNAGAALYVADRAASIAEGVERALDLLDAGAPLALLDRWIEAKVP